MDPAGQYLFAILGERELVGEELLAYPIDPSTGSLPAAPISRIAAQGSGLAVEPSGRFLYTTNTFRLNPEAGIHAFEFNRATGELVDLGFHSTDMAAVNAVAADRRGERLFVSTQSGLSRGNLVGYDIDPLAGTLSESVGNIELREPTFGIAVHPSSESIYVTTSNVVRAVAVDRATGSFSPLNTFVQGPRWVALDPSGKFLYATLGVSMYSN